MSPPSTTEYPTANDPPPAFRLENDLPGERLQLVWQGSEPRKLLRRLGGLVVALVGLAIVEFVRRLVIPSIQQALVQPPGDIIPIVVLAVFLTITGLVAAYQLLPAFGRYVGYWSALDWDRSEGAFTATFNTWGLGGNRSVQIPLSSITGVNFSIGAPTDSLLPSEMQLWYFDAKGHAQAIAVPLLVENLNRRNEAMDLLFRIARVISFAGYAINRSNHRRLELQIVRRLIQIQPKAPSPDEVEDDKDDDEDEHGSDLAAGEEYLAIPDTRDVARYGSDTALGLKQPPLPAPALNLAKLASDVELVKVAEWEPKQKVRFERPKAPPGVPAVLAVIGAMVGGAICGLPLVSFLQWLAQPWDLPHWGAVAIGAVLGAPLAVVLMWRRLEEREVTFDWTAGNVAWQQGSRRGRAALSSIESLELGGVRDDRQPGQTTRPGVKHEYRCQLKMVLKDSDQLLLETDHWASSPDVPYMQLLPVTIELARMLGVPWRWVDRHERPANPYLPRLTLLRAVAATCVIAVLFGWLALRGQAQEDKQQHLAQLRAQGVECSFLNGSSFRNLHQIKNFYKLTPQPGPDLDTRLADVRGDLSGIGRFGMELTSSGVGDAGVATLAEQPNLIQLDLAVTPISDEALAMLGTSQNIEYLNISSTQVGDAGLAHVAQLPRLAILLAAYTQVTDDGLPQLAACKELRYVNLAGTAVSDLGIRRLRAALPHAVIEK